MTRGWCNTSWFSYLVLATAGAMFPLALAPLFWWPLGLLSGAILYWQLTSCSTARQAFVRTWWYGLGQFGAGVSWVYVSMHDHGGTPAWLAIPMVAVFAAFLATFPAAWMAARQRWFGQTLAWLTFPVFWFLHEWFRSWFMTGFPWLFVGDAHLATWLAGWAPLLGSYGLSFIVLLTVTSLSQGWRQRQPAYLLFLLLWPMGAWLQGVEWTQRSGELQVSAVQGNVPQELKWKREQIEPTIATYFGESRQLWQSDVILWPETAMTLLYDRFRPYMDALAEEAQQHNTTIITGIPYRHPPGTELAGQYHNSVVAIGNGQGMYHKQRLVPFGEYVPLENLIRGWIPFFDLEMSSFLAGDAYQPPLLVRQQNGDEESLFLLAPFICYEIAYPGLVRRNASNADLLITVSNDAWFGDSLGPKQHLALAQMRALETQRYVLRATNTGITALINSDGEIVERLPFEQVATLTASAEMRQGMTPYMIWGLWPLYLLSAIILLVARRQQRTQALTAVPSN
ncbi:apolipoprotein N-acyltransferase [Bacterioplanes sanyensis]|uniref:Apolipoprotein N-acyltransferase n=1 Tax=Bacterioplanes sanyensis TaxID=1249553 RepID=A0A222FDP4_9GAMM|nr:apolipoprotein N-acyltransferase [Bacterioplanes sanyensis]ASP37207.1 apolipoprotein N-acyltransferase [Bacterioplanes sanyensis]